MGQLTARKKELPGEPTKLFGLHVPTSKTGYPRCPFCRSKEYANLRHLQKHMLWKHWTKLETLVPPT